MLNIFVEIIIPPPSKKKNSNFFFCNIRNVFTINSYEINTSLLNKNINFFQEKTTKKN